ncbi:hypothetical protein CR513_46499, partial [Mucuna pruriens]
MVFWHPRECGPHNEKHMCEMGWKEGEKSRWIRKAFILLWSSLISIAGGLVLGWWLHKYHPSNKQLWMELNLKV